jgi:hypothetical protein
VMFTQLLYIRIYGNANRSLGADRYPADLAGRCFDPSGVQALNELTPTSVQSARKALQSRFPTPVIGGGQLRVRICPIADASPSARINKESTAALNRSAAQSVQVYGRPTDERPFSQ